MFITLETSGGSWFGSWQSRIEIPSIVHNLLTHIIFVTNQWNIGIKFDVAFCLLYRLIELAAVREAHAGTIGQLRKELVTQGHDVMNTSVEQSLAIKDMHTKLAAVSQRVEHGLRGAHEANRQLDTLRADTLGQEDVLQVLNT